MTCFLDNPLSISALQNTRPTLEHLDQHRGGDLAHAAVRARRADVHARALTEGVGAAS